MRNALQVVQIISALLLVAAIISQSKGTGFGRSTSASFSRRGLERIVFRSTFVLMAIFIIVSVLQLVY